MKFTGKITNLAQLGCLLGLLTMSAFAVGQRHGDGPGGNGSRDGLAGLRRAITAANAPALTTTQETALTALITAYRDAQPDEEDAALAAARDAFDAAIIAGNQTAADTAAAQIATRQAELSAARLRALSRFEIAVLANLSSGGQLAPLTAAIGAERVLRLVSALAGRGGFGDRH